MFIFKDFEMILKRFDCNLIFRPLWTMDSGHLSISTLELRICLIDSEQKRGKKIRDVPDILPFLESGNRPDIWYPAGYPGKILVLHKY